jgi:hypothetical protein
MVNVLVCSVVVSAGWWRTRMEYSHRRRLMSPVAERPATVGLRFLAYCFWKIKGKK